MLVAGREYGALSRPECRGKQAREGVEATQQTQARRYLLALSAIAVIVFGLLMVLIAWSFLKRWAAVLIGDIRSRRFLDDAHSSSLSMPVLSQVRQVLR